MTFAKQYKIDKKSTQNLVIHPETESIRLNKYISESGVTSRRDADVMIELGRIKVNGKTALVGTKIFAGDIVTVDNEVIAPKADKIYIALNKPVGIVSTTDTAIKQNMITFMNYPEKIFPIGRLDKESSGLILLTNDGNIVNQILRAENGHDKEYIVEVNQSIDNTFIENMVSGVMIYNPVSHKNQRTLPTKVEKLSDNTFKIILKQGLNRQIRRMTDALGYHVVSLKRVRIMHIHLDNLPDGHWRYLHTDELKKLNELIKKGQGS